MMPFVDRAVTFLMKVQCERCAEYVYLDVDDARAAAEDMVQFDGVTSIEELMQYAERACNHCGSASVIKPSLGRVIR